MESEPVSGESKILLLEQLRQFLVDDAQFGRMQADLVDLKEASEWFIDFITQFRPTMSADEAESLLVNLETNYIIHATFHINSLRNEISKVLNGIDGSA